MALGLIAARRGRTTRDRVLPLEAWLTIFCGAPPSSIVDPEPWRRRWVYPYHPGWRVVVGAEVILTMMVHCWALSPECTSNSNEFGV